MDCGGDEWVDRSGLEFSEGVFDDCGRWLVESDEVVVVYCYVVVF